MVGTLVFVRNLIYVTISGRVMKWQRVLMNGTLNLAMMWIRRFLIEWQLEFDCNKMKRWEYNGNLIMNLGHDTARSFGRRPGCHHLKIYNKNKIIK